MCRPDFHLGDRAAPARRQEYSLFGGILGLHEQLRKRRMSDVGGRRCQHELGIRGDVQVPVAIAGVGERDAAHLRIVFGRNQHFQHRRHRGIDAHKFRAILGEGHRIAIGFDTARLVTGGPHEAAVDVTQEKIAAQVIARRVLTPPGYREISPAAITGTRCGEHHRVVSV